MPAQVVQEHAREPRVEGDLAGGGRAHDAPHVVEARRLGDAAVGAGADRVDDARGIERLDQDDHAGIGRLRAQRSAAVDQLAVGERAVEKDHVRTQAHRLPHRLFVARHLGHHAHVGLDTEHRTQAGPREFVSGDDHHLDPLALAHEADLPYPLMNKTAASARRDTLSFSKALER